MGQHTINQGSLGGRAKKRIVQQKRKKKFVSLFKAIAIYPIIFSTVAFPFSYISSSSIPYSVCFPIANRVGIESREGIEGLCDYWDIFTHGPLVKEAVFDNQNVRRNKADLQSLLALEKFVRTSHTVPKEQAAAHAGATVKLSNNKQKTGCTATMLTTDGWFATAAHCVDDIEKPYDCDIEIGDDFHIATYIRYDRKHDVALGKVFIKEKEGKGKPIPLRYFNSAHLRLDQPVIVVGKNSGSIEGKVTRLIKYIKSGGDRIGYTHNMTDIAAKVNHGDSGGPVIDTETGAYMGIISSSNNSPLSPEVTISKIEYILQLVSKTAREQETL